MDAAKRVRGLLLFAGTLTSVLENQSKKTHHSVAAPVADGYGEYL
jgi:hypothetical protein